jgi:hypothetical protein
MKHFFSAFVLSLFGALATAQTPTYTPNINLMVPSFGQQNWQVPTNYNWALLDKLLSGNANLPALNVTGTLTAPGLTTWNVGTNYAANVVVAYLGGFYQSLSSANVGNLPTNTTYWTPTFGTSGAPSGAANLVYATPNGTAGAAALRALVPADLPVATNSTLGTVRPDNTTITQSNGVLSVVGGSGAVTLIQEQVMTVTTPTVTFSDIPQTYKHLELVFNAANSHNNAGNVLELTFNGDSSNNYLTAEVFNSGTTPTATQVTATYVNIFGSFEEGFAVSFDGKIINYANPIPGTGVNMPFSFVTNGPGVTSGNVYYGTVSTPITSITLTQSDTAETGFVPGSVFSLYGLQ